MAALPTWQLYQHGSFANMAALPTWQLYQHGSFTNTVYSSHIETGLTKRRL
jgi:hypothetical protein